jgi:transposase
MLLVPASQPGCGHEKAKTPVHQHRRFQAERLRALTFKPTPALVHTAMRTKSSIYSRCNPQLLKLFEAAGHPGKVLCAAVDYAKAKHSVLLCTGTGELLKSRFVVENTALGAAELVRTVRACAAKRKIRPEHVFFGGEDLPSFAENFLRYLRQEKFTVIRVNAWEAKQQRDNFQASSDSLDLLGIARCCLNRQGTSVRQAPAAYSNLVIGTRDRDKLVRMRTAISNRIHAYVDRLFPGFLSQTHSGLVPFGTASLDMMMEAFSTSEIRSRPRHLLTRWLARRGVKCPKEVAAQLHELAAGALAAEPAHTRILQSSLAHAVKLYRQFSASIADADRELAYWLSRTPGARLTTIPGVGVTLAAGWMAEMGPPEQWRSIGQISSYCGVVPKTKQTGGPDKEPQVSYVQQRCNKRLKNVVLQAVEKAIQFGSEDIRQTASQLEANGSHVCFAMAKRLLRLGKYVVLNPTVYRPKALMDPDTPKATLAAYYMTLWEKLLPKWKDKADVADVFSDEHPLGQWRNMVQELYALDLRLPKPKAGATSSATP